MLQRSAFGLVLLMLTLMVPAHPAELVAPYVNTVREDVELMLDIASVGPEDYLIDLGAGDGRIVIAAAKRGARAHGVELQPELVTLATAKAKEAEVTDRVHFVQGDIFAADLSQATVVTAYLFPDANLQLRPKLLAELPPGTRVVSNAFDMGDWVPDKRLYGRTSGGAMLWIIPAQLGGEWILDMNGRQLALQIEQRYQNLVIEVREAGNFIPVDSAQLTGARITFTISTPRTVFTGLVDGERMTGQATTQAGVTTSAWRARRRS
jgi:hypothetical protein